MHSSDTPHDNVRHITHGTMTHYTWNKDSICTASNAQLRHTTWHITHDTRTASSQPVTHSSDTPHDTRTAPAQPVSHSSDPHDTLRMTKGQHLHSQQCSAQTHMTWWQTHYAWHEDSICTASNTLLQHTMQHNDRHILQNAQLRHTWHNVRNIRHDTRT